jgi:hypothetical protein
MIFMDAIPLQKAKKYPEEYFWEAPQELMC